MGYPPPMRWTARLASLLALMAPTTAWAAQLGQPTVGSDLAGATLNVQNTFYFKWNSFIDEDEDDLIPAPLGYAELLNRLSADLRIKRFTLGVQLDFVANAPGCSDSTYADRYAERFGEGAPCQPSNTLRGEGWSEDAPEAALFIPEKVYAQYRSPNLNVDLGDFYAVLGRGIVLSFVKRPEIDLDTSLFGGRVDVVFPRFDFTALAGLTNPQELSVELRNQQIRKTEATLLAGGAMRLRPVDKLEIGGHAVGYDLRERPSLGAGGTVSLTGLGDAIDLFAEVDGFRWSATGEGASAPRDGYAVYGAFTTYKGPFTLLIEGKRYRNSQLLTVSGPIAPVRFVEPPSLEFETAVTPDVNEGIQSNHITGLRVQGDLFLFQSGTRITASMLVAGDDQNHPPTSPQRETTLSPWVMLDQPISLPKAELHLRGYLGYRHDLPRRQPTEGLTDSEAGRLSSEYLRQSGLLFAHGDIGLTFGAHSIEWVTYYRRYHWTLEDDACWLEEDGDQRCDKDDGWVSIENALSYTLLGKYTAALHLDWTDDNVVQNAANGGAIGNASFDPLRRESLYVGGEFILKPVPNLEVAAFVGSQKAGIVCTGGACRTVPAFNGVKARVTVGF